MTQNSSAPTSPVRIHLVTHVSLDAGEPHGAELPGIERPGTPRILALPDRPVHDDVRPTVSSVTTRVQGTRLEVTLAGDVDLVLADELALVLTQLERHCAAVPRARVHLDVREVTAVDTSGLRFVERVRTACARHSATCTTSTARPAVEQVLALARPVVDGELAAS